MDGVWLLELNCYIYMRTERMIDSWQCHVTLGMEWWHVLGCGGFNGYHENKLFYRTENAQILKMFVTMTNCIFIASLTLELPRLSFCLLPVFDATLFQTAVSFINRYLTNAGSHLVRLNLFHVKKSFKWVHQMPSFPWTSL